MSLRRATPLQLTPKGLSDAIDGTTVFAGAMGSLVNLIPDPSTAGVWQCRPAAFSLIDFSTEGGGFSSGFSSGFQLGFSTLPIGPISALKIIGDIAYGMVKTARNIGHDEPFAYNIALDTMLTVSGVTLLNTPISALPVVAWTPPTMDLVGTNLLVTHPGYFGTSGNYFGWFDISDTTAITWSGGNLTGAITFSKAPSAVKNFNGRAYWITNPFIGQPSLIFSDVLVPRTVTSSSQALTFDDNVALTALGSLNLQNQLGGVIQALIVFKGVSNIYQVTGDAALSNLAKNALNVATGTFAPNTIAPTPKGLLFAAPDGIRLIDFNAIVSNPIGLDGSGKTLPIIYSRIPSRMCAAANGSVYRITTQDTTLAGSPFVEYWYDMTRQVWSGPHSFPAALIGIYQDTFIMAPHAVDGALWQSDYVQLATSTYTENSVAMTFTWTTVMLPDTNQMCENAMIETTLNVAAAAAATYTVSAQDQNNTVFTTASIANAGAASGLYPRPINWPIPVVFRRLKLVVAGASSAALRVSTLYMRYEQLGYLQQSAA